MLGLGTWPLALLGKWCWPMPVFLFCSPRKGPHPYPARWT